MTLPCERVAAVNNTREFLYSLLDPKQTPKVPKHIREASRRLLKHYPSEMDMDIIANKEDGVNFVNYTVFGKKFNRW